MNYHSPAIGEIIPVVIFTKDPRKIDKVWTSDTGLYLYNDGLESHFDYFERLERLSSYMKFDFATVLDNQTVKLNFHGTTSKRLEHEISRP
jgi:hypothetical protein